MPEQGMTGRERAMSVPFGFSRRGDMIRVVITGPPSGTGWFPYKIDWWAQGKPQFVGVSKQPLLDACRQLKQFGLMDDTVVGLFHESEGWWRQRTTVGYGARQMAPPPGRQRPPVRHSGEGAIPVPQTREAALSPSVEVAELDAGVPSVARQATPEEPPPPEHRHRERPADTDRDRARPAKSEKSHRRPRPKGSGARRGSR